MLHDVGGSIMTTRKSANNSLAVKKPGSESWLADWQVRYSAPLGSYGCTKSRAFRIRPSESQ